MNIQLHQLVGFSKNKPSYLFLRGAMDILPLSISVIPWAILAGSMAIQAGLSFYKALAMSGIVFAGAAQLVSLSMIMEGASAFTIYVTIFLLTAQHFIYALTLRNDISILPLSKRLSLGFLLTDELFAVCASGEKRQPEYLLGAGLSFYLFWVVFSLVGILLATVIPNLLNYHLDFSIVAIFIAMIVPLCKGLPVVAGILVTCLSGFFFKFYQVEGAILLSGLIGMLVAVLTEKIGKEQ
ncbi:branched-chain amino acid ABC transporter permease [Acinetobacter calcoaceticus]|uniref:Branched-chain amino acid ABC transporter permease n=1 Tax=Acinetobacter oleivorans TaxID=1148157 RepID=A0A0B2UCK4_9GAMM|nr:AzlC family ABC transporter permease [Acinetobacter calcoaceticus]KHN67128.1 branched-chain amino acid ABC transporter permease [Acinetobacter oleivorans]KUM11769.1 branched-chain amino acid ABC transporter permease [Acinetobacter calcoaceticus]